MAMLQTDDVGKAVQAQIQKETPTFSKLWNISVYAYMNMKIYCVVQSYAIVESKIQLYLNY